MPDKPPGQLIRELSVIVAEVQTTSNDWADYTKRDIDSLKSADSSINESVRVHSQQIAVLQQQAVDLPIIKESLQELNRKIAVIEQKVDDLRSGRLEGARRLWAVLSPLIGGVIGG